MEGVVARRHLAERERRGADEAAVDEHLRARRARFDGQLAGTPFSGCRRKRGLRSARRHADAGVRATGVR